MEDFMYKLGEVLMMEMDDITDIAYPRDEKSTLIITTCDAEYVVTIAERKA